MFLSLRCCDTVHGSLFLETQGDIEAISPHMIKSARRKTVVFGRKHFQREFGA